MKEIRKVSSLDFHIICEIDQEQTNPPENFIEESNIFGNINVSEVGNKEEHDKLKNEENSEDNSTHQIRQEATVESIRLVDQTTAEDMDEKSRELVDDKVTFDSLKLMYFELIY